MQAPPDDAWPAVDRTKARIASLSGMAVGESAATVTSMSDQMPRNGRAENHERNSNGHPSLAGGLQSWIAHCGGIAVKLRGLWEREQEIGRRVPGGGEALPFAEADDHRHRLPPSCDKRGLAPAGPMNDIGESGLHVLRPQDRRAGTS
jgi:hypothetical protein